MFDRKLFKNFDIQLLLFTLALCVFGLIVISSATQGMNPTDPLAYVRKQGTWIAMGLSVLLVVISIDYNSFYRLSWYLYGMSVFFLVLVLFMGRDAGGSYRWIDLGFFDFQPSELAKVIIIVVLARLLVDYRDKLQSLGSMLLFLLPLAAPMLLIFLQPDLGTALVFVVIVLGMLYMGGVPLRNLMILTGAGLAVIPFIWSRLLPYQQMRLMIFMNPDLDPLGHGYQVMQSMIAVGSGGVSGKGLYEGTQARLQFLIEQHTDFIFSVLGEELGFIGGAVLLLLYFILIYRVLRLASLSKDNFGALVCTGVAIMISFQVFVNIGMTLSMMPVTGLPLPFMSYGGNSMLMHMIAIGLVLNIGMRRHKIQF